MVCQVLGQLWALDGTLEPHQVAGETAPGTGMLASELGTPFLEVASELP